MLSVSLNKTFPSFLLSESVPHDQLKSTRQKWHQSCCVVSELIGHNDIVTSICVDGKLLISARCYTLYPLSYFSFQPVLHDWCNKGRGMCYPVCGMVHIKEPLLLIDKSSVCGGSRFPFSLSEWSLTICLTPYNCR